MDSVSKNEITNRIEYIMSYLLSKKYNADIKIYLKKDVITNDNDNKSSTIRKK